MSGPPFPVEAESVGCEAAGLVTVEPIKHVEGGGRSMVWTPRKHTPQLLQSQRRHGRRSYMVPVDSLTLLYLIPTIAWPPWANLLRDKTFQGPLISVHYRIADRTVLIQHRG